MIELGVRYFESEPGVMEPKLAQKVLDEFRALNEKRKSNNEKDEPEFKFQKLTPREEEMLNMVVQGKPNKIIADHFSISENTVRNHLASVFEKLQVNNRTEAAVMAYKNARDPMKGVSPRKVKAKDYPEEYGSAEINKPSKRDLVTLENIIHGIDSLNNQLGPYGKPIHSAGVYNDAIDAIHSSLLRWKDSDLNSAAELVMAHKFGQAKKIVEKVSTVANKDRMRVQKSEDKEEKLARPIDEQVDEEIQKRIRYRQNDFAKRRNKTFAKNILGGKYS